MIRDEEKTIIKKAQKGDIAAFEELVTTYEGFVYNLALRTLRSEQDAQDEYDSWLENWNAGRETLMLAGEDYIDADIEDCDIWEE